MQRWNFRIMNIRWSMLTMLALNCATIRCIRSELIFLLLLYTHCRGIFRRH